MGQVPFIELVYTCGLKYLMVFLPHVQYLPVQAKGLTSKTYMICGDTLPLGGQGVWPEHTPTPHLNCQHFDIITKHQWQFSKFFSIFHVM